MATKETEIKSVPSTPEKSFFISMLTRDIDLADAILDLLDNCIDGAIRSRSASKAKTDSFSDFWAHIEFDEHKFIIEDNCGGIPWAIAHEYAFRMGRPAGVPTEAGSIGVVGIGMKRAIFKMGRSCTVHSNHRDDTFLVTIPQRWFSIKNWTEFEAEREKPLTKNYGTIIEITDLTEDTRKDFDEGSSFRSNFNQIVAESYSMLIEKGFEVTINKVRIKPRPVKLYFESPNKPNKQHDLIRPYIYEARMGTVKVFMAVGYRSPIKTQQELDDEAKSSFAAKEAGWTVICNNRVVLSNDRSVKTGWGLGSVPNFHNQFSPLAGIVEFRSRNTADLPITTTKRGIDTGKDIYAVIRQRMQDGLKYFTKNTNRWKGHEAELKRRFKDLPVLDVLQLQELAEKLPLKQIRGHDGQRQLVPELPEKKKLITTRRIVFDRKITEIETVSRYLFDDVREPNEVGETCFDRTLKEAGK
jgi:hypothetical protein